MQFIETAVSESFIREVSLPDPEMSLARAGLFFAEGEYPELDCSWYLGQLDLIAACIEERLDRHSNLAERLGAMNRYLFNDLGYAGNVDDYYDPRNSYLNEVIDRRLGLPITLSIVFLELAERIGLRAHGVSFPGHFLVAVSDFEHDIIVDAFDGGLTLSRATFIQRLHDRATSETSVEALEATLSPASNADILLRQLRNLKATYAKQGNVQKTLNLVNHMLAVDQNLLTELLERAALYDTLGYARGAAQDYERALDRVPNGIEREEISARLASALTKVQRLH